MRSGLQCRLEALLWNLRVEDALAVGEADEVALEDRSTCTGQVGRAKTGLFLAGLPLARSPPAAHLRLGERRLAVVAHQTPTASASAGDCGADPANALGYYQSLSYRQQVSPIASPLHGSIIALVQQQLLQARPAVWGNEARK
jgi:hypothetical protein